jgi:hypothetical protein
MMKTRFYDRHDRVDYLKACEVARRIVCESVLIEVAALLRSCPRPRPKSVNWSADWPIWWVPRRSNRRLVESWWDHDQGKQAMTAATVQKVVSTMRTAKSWRCRRHHYSAIGPAWRMSS